MITLAAATLVKIAVLNLTATNVDQALVDNLSEVLVTEVQGLDRFQVISRSDIAQMLGFEAQKQLLSCEAESCLAEIGGALGVGLIVAGNVGKLEDLYLLNLKIIDMTGAKVLARTSSQVEGRAKELIAELKKQVPVLFAKYDGKPVAEVAPVPAPVAEVVKPPLPVAVTTPVPEAAEGSALRPVAWGSVGLAAVAALAGVAFRFQLNAAYDRYHVAVADDAIAAAREETSSKATLALVSAAIAGVAGVAGGAGLLLLP